MSLQKLGELLLKAHDPIGASEVFARVAEHCATEGFFLKAVALTKQVLKLNPGHPTGNEKLAELHHRLQLTSEAIAYLHLALDQYGRAGDHAGEARMRERLASLGVDPDGPHAPRSHQRAAWAQMGPAMERLAAARRSAEMNDLPTAIRLAKEAVVKLNPRLVEANELLATWSAQLGAADDAIVYWRSALRQHEAARDAEGIARVQAALAALGAATGAKA